MKTSKNISIHDKSKLVWACRRGMLELDVLLGNFLEEAYPQLSDEEKNHFILLLDSQDPSLFAWLMGHEEPKDEALAAISEKIRNHARSRIRS
jgi:antitoxin CptB